LHGRGEAALPCIFLYEHGVGKKEMLGVASATSRDSETTERRRVASHTRFVGHRLRTGAGITGTMRREGQANDGSGVGGTSN
jgi:hypothetical protein